MKTRKLELECLEDRCVPATSLSGTAPPVEPPTEPAAAFIAGPETTPSFAINLFRLPARPLGHLTTNHNETLVHQPRRKKNRRN